MPPCRKRIDIGSRDITRSILTRDVTEALESPSWRASIHSALEHFQRACIV